MKNNRNIHLTVCFVFFLAINFGYAQDIHYSQFYNSPTNINPALTGVFNGDKRLTGSIRDQWRSVPVPWTTVSLAYDQKFYLKNSDKGFFSGGLLYNFDRNGDSRLTLNNLNVLGSYTRLLNENNVISLGAVLGFASRGFDIDDLSWDLQWNGQVADLTRPSGESFDASRVNFFESGLGLNYRWQQSSRTNLNLGAGVLHLVQPKANFNDAETQKLPRRLTLSGVGSVKITDRFDIQLHALSQFQNSYRELVMGGLGKIYLNQKRGKETAIHLGMGYRTSGFLFPTVALEYKSLYISGSWDMDLTDFSAAHSGITGGPEFHIRYIMTSVKPLKKFKACPIF